MGQIILCTALVVAGSMPAGGQAPPAPASTESPEPTRITRLQDSLAAGEDWDIGMPVIEAGASTDSSFAGLIRAGQALDSEAYFALDRELRQVQRLLQARPEDEAARQRLEELQDALLERIETNIDFDYLYAAAVYIELFRQAGGSDETVRRFSRQIRERRSASGG